MWALVLVILAPVVEDATADVHQYRKDEKGIRVGAGELTSREESEPQADAHECEGKKTQAPEPFRFVANNGDWPPEQKDQENVETDRHR